MTLGEKLAHLSIRGKNWTDPVFPLCSRGGETGTCLFFRGEKVARSSFSPRKDRHGGKTAIWHRHLDDRGIKERYRKRVYRIQNSDSDRNYLNSTTWQTRPNISICSIEFRSRSRGSISSSTRRLNEIPVHKYSYKSSDEPTWFSLRIPLHKPDSSCIATYRN